MSEITPPEPGSRWSRLRSSRGWRWIVLGAIGLLGLLVGAGLGASGVEAETTTQTLTTTVTRTKTKVVVKTKVVRKPTITVRQTVTEEVPAGGDGSVDYGGNAGTIEIRGVQGYRASGDYGYGKVLGQIQAPAGCGYTRIDATFYMDGRIVATQFTNFTALPAGSWFPFEITLLEGDFDSYDLVVTEAQC